MSRKSLRPNLNQIRTWVRQGRTDAWIAHQLEVTVQQIQAFKREQELDAEGDGDATTADSAEVDLRAEDDAAIAAELDAEEERRRAEEEAKAAEEAARQAAAVEAGEDPDAEAEDDKPKRAARPRRGRGRARKAEGPYEATFDHGEEGYGLWLDPAVADDAVYAEHWAGHRPVEVTVEEDQIVIRRAGAGSDD
jgi:hypothetical protein